MQAHEFGHVAGGLRVPVVGSGRIAEAISGHRDCDQFLLIQSIRSDHSSYENKPRFRQIRAKESTNSLKNGWRHRFKYIDQFMQYIGVSKATISQKPGCDYDHFPVFVSCFYSQYLIGVRDFCHLGDLVRYLSSLFF
jgi:hypothetical protein